MRTRPLPTPGEAASPVSSTWLEPALEACVSFDIEVPPGVFDGREVDGREITDEEDGEDAGAGADGCDTAADFGEERRALESVSADLGENLLAENDEGDGTDGMGE